MSCSESVEHFPWYATLPGPAGSVLRGASSVLVWLLPAVVTTASALQARAAHVVEVIDHAEHQEFLEDMWAEQAYVDDPV